MFLTIYLIISKMEKLYFRVIQSDFYGAECLDECTFLEKPDKIKIGSYTCRCCRFCYGIDLEENWVKCEKHDLEIKGKSL